MRSFFLSWLKGASAMTDPSSLAGSWKFDSTGVQGRDRAVKSIDELKARILNGIEEFNASPVVFRWNKFDLGVACYVIILMKRTTRCLTAWAPLAQAGAPNTREVAP